MKFINTNFFMKPELNYKINRRLGSFIFYITGSINAAVSQLVERHQSSDLDIVGRDPSYHNRDAGSIPVMGVNFTDSNVNILPDSMIANNTKPFDQQHKVPTSVMGVNIIGSKVNRLNRLPDSTDITKPIERRHMVPTKIIVSQSATDPENVNIDNNEDNTEDKLSKKKLKMSIPWKPERSLSLHCAIVLPAAPLCSDRLFH